MKKIAIVILALMLISASVSCSKDADTTLPEGMALLDNDATDYYFYYPETWNADRNDGMVSAYVSDTDRSNVSVTTFAASSSVTNVDDYLKMGDTTYFDNMKETFTDLVLITDGEETVLGEAPAKQFVFTASVGGESYKFKQVICYSKGYIYILTYTSTEEGFDTHTDEVAKIISEFKFK